MPVVEVVAATVGEPRYRVFQNSGLATYYESQLQAVVTNEAEQIQLAAEAIHAYLTSLQLLAPSTANLYSLRSGRVKFIPFSLFDKDLVFGPDKPNKKHLGLIKLDPPPKFDLVIVIADRDRTAGPVKPAAVSMRPHKPSGDGSSFARRWPFSRFTTSFNKNP